MRIPPIAAGVAGCEDLSPPRHLQLVLPPRRRSRADAVSRRIARLLHLHPALDQDYRDFNLLKSAPVDRSRVLAELHARLGIA